MSTEFVYISGICHSGSTLLDRLISTSADVYGFGEIYKYLLDGLRSTAAVVSPLTNVVFGLLAPLNLF